MQDPTNRRLKLDEEFLFMHDAEHPTISYEKVVLFLGCLLGHSKSVPFCAIADALDRSLQVDSFPDKESVVGRKTTDGTAKRLVEEFLLEKKL